MHYLLCSGRRVYQLLMICLLLFKSEMFDEATSKEIDVTRSFCDFETSAKSEERLWGPGRDETSQIVCRVQNISQHPIRSRFGRQKILSRNS